MADYCASCAPSAPVVEKLLTDVSFGTVDTSKGPLPPHFTANAHEKRVLAQLESKTTNIEKYIYLNGLKGREPHTFYRILIQNMTVSIGRRECGGDGDDRGQTDQTDRTIIDDHTYFVYPYGKLLCCRILLYPFLILKTGR